MSNKQMIFIGGLHRSGTSLIHQILRSHPDATGFTDTGVPEDEGQHLQTVYKPAKAFGGPGEFGFNPDAYMDETHPLATTDNAEKLLSQWRQYWDTSKDFWFEKSPPNIIRTRFLQALYPNAKFVIILRHPVAVAYATKKWSKTSTGSLLEHNLLCYERLYADLAHLKQSYVISYEEFVQQPQKTLDALLGWAGMAPLKLNVEVKTDINEKYFDMFEKEKVSFWKSKRLRKAITEKHLETRANHFGYSVLKPNQRNNANWFGRYQK